MSEQFMTFSGPTIEIPPPNSIVIDMTKLDEICERAQGDGGGMRQTDRLRELLTERGAKWFDADGRVVIGVDEPATVASFKDYDGLLLGMMYTCCTPEQAIEATLAYIEAEREVDRLQAENAKLREELDAAKHDLSVFSEEIVAAKAENAKLRELVRDMCVWAYIDSDCDLEDRFADRMAELGVDA